MIWQVEFLWAFAGCVAFLWGIVIGMHIESKRWKRAATDGDKIWLGKNSYIVIGDK